MKTAEDAEDFISYPRNQKKAPQYALFSSASSGVFIAREAHDWGLATANKKPTGCLLGACSGQHPMGYRFSLLTLLFSGVCTQIKHGNFQKFRLIL